MATGTGSVLLQNIPTNPFVVDPGAFFQMTRKNVVTNEAVTVGSGKFQNRRLPTVGIVSKLQLVFQGTVTVATAAATTSDLWPHGLLSQFTLSANGQNELVSASGLDLHALRFLRYPAFSEAVDVFPGTLGGGNSVAVGSYPIYLTFEVPMAMDDMSLVGALFAQSQGTNLNIKLTEATAAELFSANPGNVTIAGAWTVQETFFDIPLDAQGNQVLPDLSRLHGINSVLTPFLNTGDVKAPLIRSAGQLTRLLVSARSSATNRLSAAPNAATSKLIDAIRLEYGGNQKPQVFDPAATLLALNNQHYGATVPYDRLVLDFVRENPQRDVIYMQGVTELNVVPKVNAGVTVSAGEVRVVQETLY
jgi:hypothetical protein